MSEKSKNILGRLKFTEKKAGKKVIAKYDAPDCPGCGKNVAITKGIDRYYCRRCKIWFDKTKEE